MPVVPVAENTQQLRPVTDGGYRAADFASGAVAVGRAVEDFGEQANRFTAKLDEAAAKQLDVEYSAFESQVLYGSPDGKVKGYSQLEGIDADAARAGVQEQLDQKRAELMTRAGGGRRGGMLGQVLQQRATQTNALISRHHTTEMKRYTDATELAFIENKAGEAVRLYDKPEMFAEALSTGLRAVEERNQSLGLEYAQAKRGEFQTKVFLGAVDSYAATGDVRGALGFLEVNKDRIEPNAYNQALARLRPAVEEYEVEEIVDVVRGTQTLYPEAPQPVDNLVPGVVWMEHRGGDQTRTSPAGARGKMQIMPDTAKEIAGELGIPFDLDRLSKDAAYNTKIGTAYLRKLGQQFGHNSVLVLAAYNGGMGNVKKWIEAIGDPRTGAVSSAEFAARIPFKETRNYVAGALSYGRGVDRGPKNKPDEVDLNVQLAKVDEMAAEQGWEPKKVSAVKRGITSAAALDARLLGDVREKAYDTALDLADKGQFVPPSLLAGLSGAQQRTVKSEIERVKGGTDGKSSPVEVVEIVRAAADNPAKFINTNPNEWRGRVSEAERASLMKLQDQYRSQGPVDPASVKAVADRLFDAHNMSLSGKAAEKNAPKYEAYRRKLTEAAATWSRNNNGKPVDDATMLKLGDNLLLRAYNREGVNNVGDEVFLFEVTTRNAGIVTSEGPGYSGPTTQDEQAFAVAYEEKYKTPPGPGVFAAWWQRGWRRGSAS